MSKVNPPQSITCFLKILIPQNIYCYNFIYHYCIKQKYMVCESNINVYSSSFCEQGEPIHPSRKHYSPIISNSNRHLTSAYIHNVREMVPSIDKILRRVLTTLTREPMDEFISCLAHFVAIKSCVTESSILSPPQIKIKKHQKCAFCLQPLSYLIN